MRYVTFDNEGKLTGAFLQDLHADHAECFIEVDSEVYSNWTSYEFDGVGLAVKPPAPAPDPQPAVPAAITPRQGLIMLSRAGLLTAVRQALDSMEGQAGEEARIDFDYASEWRRDWPLLILMAEMVGRTPEQVDQMFIAAAALWGDDDNA